MSAFKPGDRVLAAGIVEATVVSEPTADVVFDNEKGKLVRAYPVSLLRPIDPSPARFCGQAFGLAVAGWLSESCTLDAGHGGLCGRAWEERPEGHPERRAYDPERAKSAKPTCGAVMEETLTCVLPAGHGDHRDERGVTFDAEDGKPAQAQASASPVAIGDAIEVFSDAGWRAARVDALFHDALAFGYCFTDVPLSGGGAVSFDRTDAWRRPAPQPDTVQASEAVKPAACVSCGMVTFASRAAEKLADEVDVLVRRKVIDARSPAADALLSYREPPSSERSCRIAELEAEVARLRRASTPPPGHVAVTLTREEAESVATDLEDLHQADADAGYESKTLPGSRMAFVKLHCALSELRGQDERAALKGEG